MKTFWKILLLVVLLAGALAGGYFGYQALAERFSPSSVPAAVPASPASEAPAASEAAPADGAGNGARNGDASPGLDDGRRPGRGDSEDASGGGSPAEEAPGAAQAPVENPAPDFSVLDRSGNTVSLSDFYGKPVVLNFWASWCGPCVGELPGFQAMYDAYGDRVVFLMVNLTDGTDETVEGVSAFVDQNGYTFPVYFDTEYNGVYAYAITSIPQTYFISPEGGIVGSQLGSMEESVLEANILALLAG